MEYCLVYAKRQDLVVINKVDKTQETFRNLNDAPTPLETRPDMGYTVYYNENTNDMIPVKDYDKEKIYLNVEGKSLYYRQEPYFTRIYTYKTWYA